MGKEYISNCFIEAIRAKIKHGKQIRLIRLPAKSNQVFCVHWMWHNLIDDNVYDFHATEAGEHWWQFILFKGSIRIRPFKIWKRWLKKGK